MECAFVRFPINSGSRAMFTAIRRASANLLLLNPVCSHHPLRHRSSAFWKEGDTFSKEIAQL
jgi:hypothetical protein